MKSARSVLKLVLSSAVTLLLASHCVVKTNTDDTCEINTFKLCTCASGESGKKACNAQGTGYGACICDGTNPGTGGSNTTGGSNASGGSGETSGGSASGGGSSTGGSSPKGGSANSGGSATTTGGAGNSGGANDAGGGGVSDAGSGGDGGGATGDSCIDCLSMKCGDELDACLADELCISPDSDGSGQFEQVSICVESQRPMGSVKRQALRDCGTMVSQNLNAGWPPEDMTPATLNLINCLATGSSGLATSNDWAADENLMQKWVAGTCAQLACTSAQ